MMMLASSMDNLSIGNAGILALLGYGVVFVGLIALMVVVILLGKAFSARKEKKAEAPAAAAPAPVAAAPVAEAPAAPGTAGQLKTYDVPPKTCAMLMAIVANQLNKPLNELRFISIKEVK